MLLLGSAAFAQEVPKADIFFGYSFLRANSDQSIPAFTANGGLFNAGFNFTNHIALEAEFGGYHNGNVNDKEFDTTSYSFLFGPRFSMGRSRRVDPYFHVLFGVNHATTSIAASSVLIPSPLPPNAPVPSSNGRYETDQTNFAMAAGGGLDIKLTRHVVLRPIQLDYYLTRFETPNILSPTGTTSNRNQNNLRYAAGIMFNLGGERPTPIPPAAIVNPPPAMRNCPGGTQVPAADECPKLTARLGITATPNSVCPGDTSRVTASGTLPEGATLSWTVNGEAISQAPALEFGGTGRQPGTYRVGLTVTAEGYNNASAETTITVPNWVAPTGSLTANPQEISVGQGSTLSANFSGGQCGGPLGPITYTASEGTVRGNQFDSTGVRFDPAGATEQRKTVSLTAKVNDRVGSASANGSVVVKQAAALSAQRLSDVVFQPGSDRVNNCGKRVLLEDLKNRFAADPNGRVVLVGHVAQSENATGLDLKRAMNGAAVISAGSGICSKVPASQVLVKGTGAADNGIDFQPNFCAASAGVSERPGQAVPESEAAKARRLEVWFVPAGGMLPPSGDGTRDAASLNVSSLGCPN
jgi:opacity protein-like surface antigen